MISQNPTRAPVLAVIAIITGLVFIVDSITHFGVEFRVLYLIALALTAQQHRPELPLIVAGVQVVLTTISFSLKPASCRP